MTYFTLNLSKKAHLLEHCQMKKSISSYCILLLFCCSAVVQMSLCRRFTEIPTEIQGHLTLKNLFFYKGGVQGEGTCQKRLYNAAEWS